MTPPVPKPTMAMPKWLAFLMCCLLSVLIFWFTAANAQTTPPDQPRDVLIFPDRILPPPRSSLKIHLKSAKVNTSIRNNIATTTVEQVYVNESGRTVEAKYLFPLPEGANLSSFTMTINGKPVEAKVMEKDQARNTYLETVRKYIDPGLLEYMDNNTVQLSIAPFFDKEEKKIQITYSQVLSTDGGMTQYKYPFHMEKNPASKPLPDQIPIQIQLQTEAPLKTIFSTTHQPDIDRKGTTEATITQNLLTAKDNKAAAAPDQPFTLYFSQDRDPLSLNALAYRANTTDPGYFMISLVPPMQTAKTKPVPKDIVLVLDTSGSMSGEKLTQAKEALKYIVEHTSPSDRLALVRFETDVFSEYDVAQPANDSVKKTILAAVAGAQASGGTNIEGALSKAYAIANNSEERTFAATKTPRPQYIIFLTDGEPTIGNTSTDALVKIVTDAQSDARLFNFGVGYDVNTKLLGKLADAGQGQTTYVEPQENLELALTRFYEKIDAPVLTDVAVSFGDMKAERVYPQKLGDLFAGSEVILMGRFKENGNHTITLTGFEAGEKRTYTFPVQWEGDKLRQHTQLPRLWAGRRVAALMEQIHQNGEQAELKDEIVALGKQFGILTPYTSFLAMEPEGALSREDRRRIPSPVPMSAAPAGGAALKAQTGRSAIKMQKAIQNLQTQSAFSQAEYSDTESAGSVAVLPLQTIGTKTFAQTKGIWVDTAYDEKKQGKPTHTVTFGSKEYFDLLAKYPELTDFFKLGDALVVVYTHPATGQTMVIQVMPPANPA